ncbi:MAG: hypothetical protein GXO10_07580, partial [Crenarchaeota archaeon]|nr:hypothetical protein [Thermoproteota archaeon]
MPVKKSRNRKSNRTASKSSRKINPFNIYNKFMYLGDESVLEDLCQFTNLFNPARLITYTMSNPNACILFNKYFNTTELWNCKIPHPVEYFRWWRQLFRSFDINRSIWLKKTKEEKGPIAKIRNRLRKIHPLLSDTELDLIINLVGVRSLVMQLGLDLSKSELAKLEKEPDLISNNSASNNQSTILDDIRQYCSKANNQAYCSQCPLHNSGQALFDTNSSDGKDIDVLFIAEGPGQTEAETGIPFTGRAGQQIFRPIINKHCSNIKWMMWNTVLCRPPNNRNPNDDEIRRCRRFLDYVIEKIQPKIIIAVGLVSARNLTGQDVKLSSGPKLGYYRDIIPLWLLPHPAYVLRNKDKLVMLEKNLLQALSSLNVKTNDLNIDKVKLAHVDVPASKFKHNPITDTLLDQYRDYLDRNKYHLLDVQKLQNDEYIAIFVDINTKEKRYLKFDSYYYYRANSPYRIIEIDKCMYRILSTREARNAFRDECGYYGDIRVHNRIVHDITIAQDQVNKDNPVYKPDIYYLDIECEFDDDPSFPDPLKARVPVCILTREFRGEKKTFYYIPKQVKCDRDVLKNIDHSELIECKDEIDLLNRFRDDIRKCNPDIVTGWNIFYDLATIVNRMVKAHIDPGTLSPFGEYSLDPRTNVVHLKGYIVLDMLHLYQRFTYSGRESYKLGYIASLEIGETKVEHDIDIRHTFTDDYAKFLIYNIQDVALLGKLNNKLGYIDLCGQLRRIANCDWHSTVAGQSFVIDSLLMSYLYERGLVAKNAPEHVGNEKYPGAYVHPPKSGLHEYIIDLDFASLYPSIIRTFNIGVETLEWVVEGIDVKKFLFDPNAYNDNDTVTLIHATTGSRLDTTVGELRLALKEKYTMTMNGCLFYRSKVKKSTIADCVAMLIAKRTEYKKKLAETGDKIYNRIQLAYKYLANSIYGFLGFKRSRFYDLRLASAITLSAQETTISTIYNVENYLGNREEDINRLFRYLDHKIDDAKYVIYGDTDSLFIVLSDYLDKNLLKEIETKPFQERLDTLNPIIKEIESNINNLIKRFFNRYHFLADDEQYLKVKQEWLGEIMLQLPVKKRYALRLITPKGYKFTVTGLDIKRSDYPEFCKTLLQDLINIIFDAKALDVNKIMKFVNEQKIKLLRAIKNRDITIARPVTMTKSFEQYKKLPAHVIGMLLWNALEYKIFTKNGDKGYSFPIKGLDLRAGFEKTKTYNEFMQ